MLAEAGLLPGADAAALAAIDGSTAASRQQVSYGSMDVLYKQVGLRRQLRLVYNLLGALVLLCGSLNGHRDEGPAANARHSVCVRCACD